MVTFTDKFQRTDRDIDGDNGWQAALDSEGGVGNAAEILDRYLTNSPSDDAVWVVQQTTVPTGVAQQVRINATSFVQAADATVAAVIGAKASLQGAQPSCILAELAWLPNGERVLTLRYGDNLSAGELASVTLVAQGGVAQDVAHGRMLASPGDSPVVGKVGVLQELRLIVTEAEGGLRVRAYVNEPDDDTPTLQAMLWKDWLPVVASDGIDEWGGFGVRFGNSGTAESLVVTSFYGEDYAPTTRETVVQRDNWPTLQEVTDRITRAYRGAANTTSDLDWVRDMVADEVDFLVNDCGDDAWWLRRQAELELTFDGDGNATMPSYVRRVLGLRKAQCVANLPWPFEYLDDNGNVVIRGPTSVTETVVAHYLLSYRRPAVPTDRVPIPREHLEAVVTGVSLRLAERDRRSDLVASYASRYAALRQQLQNDMARHSNQRRRAMRYTPHREHPMHRYGGYVPWQG